MLDVAGHREAVAVDLQYGHRYDGVFHEGPEALCDLLLQRCGGGPFRDDLSDERQGNCAVEENRGIRGEAGVFPDHDADDIRHVDRVRAPAWVGPSGLGVEGTGVAVMRPTAKQEHYGAEPPETR